MNKDDDDDDDEVVGVDMSGVGSSLLLFFLSFDCLLISSCSFFSFSLS